MFNSLRMKINLLRRIALATALFVPLSLSGCFGGGTSSSLQAPASTTGTVVSGTATKGPVSGATVTVYALDPSTASYGAVLGTGTTDASGNFDFTLDSNPNGPVAIVVTGGHYVSEADHTISVSSTGPMCAMVADVSSGLTGLSITPLSDMACSVAAASASSSGSATAAIEAADKFVMKVYGLTTAPEGILPDFSSSAITGGTDGGKLALVLAGLDKLSADLVAAGVLTPATRDDIYGALSKDIADGKFDGLTGGVAVPLAGGTLPFTAGSTDFVGALSSVPTSLFGGADISADVASISSGIATISPPSVGITATSSGAMSTLAMGGHQYLFVAARGKGVEKVDVTDPTHPVVLTSADGWKGSELVNHFTSGSIGGAQIITGLAAGAQLLVFSYGEQHIALVDPTNGAVTYEGDLTLTNPMVSFSGGSAYIAGAIPVAGAGAWLATSDGYQFLDANATVAGGAAPVITKSYPVGSSQELAENVGGDMAHGYLLAANYSGIQLVNVSSTSGMFPTSGSFTLDPNYSSGATSFTNFDGGTVDSALGVGILTYEDMPSALFVDMNHISVDGSAGTFTPATSNGLADVQFANSTYPQFSGSAVDPVTHQALLMAGYSNDLSVVQIQDPANVPAGTPWTGASDWIFYTLGSAYSYATDPHAVAVIDIDGKSYGYLLNGSTAPVGLEQIDMGAMLAMARKGPSGDASHQPSADPTVAGGPITAISFP